MLESLHNVERRVEQPQKKVKTASEDLHNGKRVNTSDAHRGIGIVGEYMTPDTESTKDKRPALPRAIDLTIGEQEAILH
jgi:hypothetical protein